MSIISFQTCFTDLSISLCSNKGEIFTEFGSLKNNQSSEIDVVLSKVISTNNKNPANKTLSINAIDTIFCSNGPGSFTGVRIGIAFCKGLVAFSKTNLYYLSNNLANINNFLLEIEHKKYLSNKIIIASIVDGLFGEVYIQFFEFEDKILKPLSKIYNHPIKTIENFIEDFIKQKKLDSYNQKINFVAYSTNYLITDALNKICNNFSFELDFNNSKLPTSQEIVQTGLWCKKNCKNLLDSHLINYVREALK
jgi:tRNA threonylcarbamoyladenosine biosynthesis protein TsaB